MMRPFSCHSAYRWRPWSTPLPSLLKPTEQPPEKIQLSVRESAAPGLVSALGRAMGASARSFFEQRG